MTAERAPVGQLEVALRALQRLDGRFLVDADDDRLVGRSHVEADYISRLGGEFGIVALAPRFPAVEIDPLLAQEAPHLLLVNVAQFGGDQSARPAREPSRHRALQNRKNAPAGLGIIFRRRAGTRPIRQAGQPLTGVATAPGADRERHYTDSGRNRPRRAPFGGQKYNACASHLALFARRRPKSSFKHQTILRPEPDLRCFGYHPNC